MTTYTIALFTSLLVSALLTRTVRDQALARGWVDHARSSRKIHVKPIPRLGGVAIVLGFFAPLLGLLLIRSDVGAHFRAQPMLIAALGGGGLAIAGLGLYDDFRGATARQKFAVQFGIAALMYAAGFRIEQITSPFGPPVALGVLALPVTLLWITGVVNAVNLIDGLDGLAGGVALFGVATNFVLALVRGDIVLCLLMVALAGALLGFLIFNFNPASIFMGDTGSMFLGFVLAVASLQTSSKGGTVVSMLVPIVTLGLPLMDTSLSMGRRFLMGRSMFSADKDHVHHRVMRRWALSHRATVLVLYAISCLFTLAAVALSMATRQQSMLILAALGGAVALLVRALGYFDRRELMGIASARERNAALRGLLRTLRSGAESARSPEALWAAVEPVAGALGSSQLELELHGDAPPRSRRLKFTRQTQASAGAPLRVRFPLKVEAHELGALVVAWEDGRAEVNRDEELALEKAARVLAKAAFRLQPREVAAPDARITWIRAGREHAAVLSQLPAPEAVVERPRAKTA